MRKMVDRAIEILQDPKRSLDEFGALLDETWQLKRTLSSLITTSHIDEIYNAGRKAGAIGGKLLGAGGGGFILFYAKPEVQPKIKMALANLLHVPFKFDNTGSEIIYNYDGDTPRVA